MTALISKQSSNDATWLQSITSLSSQFTAILLLSASVIACAHNEIKWTEEVKLSDGRVIQLQRRVELTESGFPVQQRGFIKYHEICYAPMNVRWKSRA